MIANHLGGKLVSWRIARATRAMMAPTIIYLELVGDFWTTWTIVYGAQR